MKNIILVSPLDNLLKKSSGLLDRADVRIIRAVTGADALRILREQRVHLIVAELDMPDMGGECFCSLVRKANDPMDISITLICRDTPEDLKRVGQSAADAWVTKPVRPEQLLENIGKVLAIPIRKGYRILMKTNVQGARVNVPFFCTSHDISSTGMLIETDKLFAHGDRISCHFSLPGTRQISAEGKTVRSMMMAGGSCYYGIRFIDLAPEFRAEIERFIDAAPRLGMYESETFFDAIPFS